MSKARYLGVLNDHHNLAPAGIHDKSSIIVFTSLDQAHDMFRKAEEGGHFYAMHGHDLQGNTLLPIPGGVSLAATLDLWMLDSGGGEHDNRDDYFNCWEVLHEVEAEPDFQLTFGPRWGIIRSRYFG